MNLGLAIRIRRRQGELSQRELGRRAGVSAAYLSLVENGRRFPNVSTLERLAGALSLSIDALIWDAVDAPRNLNDEELRLFEFARALIRRSYEDSHGTPPTPQTRSDAAPEGADAGGARPSAG